MTRRLMGLHSRQPGAFLFGPRGEGLGCGGVVGPCRNGVQLAKKSKKDAKALWSPLLHAVSWGVWN